MSAPLLPPMTEGDAEVLAERLETSARKGCWCETTRKPCENHDHYIDGMYDLIRAMTHFGGPT